jgi:hypothetical protein
MIEPLLITRLLPFIPSTQDLTKALIPKFYGPLLRLETKISTSIVHINLIRRRHNILIY